MQTLQLRSGDRMPALGLGTWLSEPGEVAAALRHALSVGYRHVDCAHIYLNETEIGGALEQAFAARDVAREDLWVTSKLWNDHHAPEHVRVGLETTLRNLGLDYLDLYLIHWPVAHAHGVLRPSDATGFLSWEQMPLAKTWEAMVALLDTGLVRNVGVSNFSAAKIAAITDAVGMAPSADQVELHPFHQQRALVDALAQRSIVATAYAPLGSSGRPPHLRRADEHTLLEHPTISSIARAHGASPAQVALAWGLARGTAVIPKSTNPGRIEENFAASQLELSNDQISAIDRLERGERYISGAFWCPEGSPYTVESIWA